MTRVEPVAIHDDDASQLTAPTFHRFPRAPAFWFGTPINGIPRINRAVPWNDPNIGILVNAADILSKGKTTSLIKESGIHEFLETHLPVMIDSGGFLFQKRKHITVTIPDLVALYDDAQPDVAVALDHPLDPHQSRSQDYIRRYKTHKMLRVLLQSGVDCEIMPVVHGYTSRQLKNSCEKTREIFKDALGREPRYVGLGSMVPLFKPMNGTGAVPRGREGDTLSPVQYALRSVSLVKHMFPRSKIHVFGVGGATTMHLLYASGVDSLDSVGWRLKAAYGAIQMVGCSDRFLTPRENPRRKVLEPEYDKAFLNCECGIKPHTREILDGSFQNRAIHNAYVYHQELQWIREFREQPRFLDMVTIRLQTSPLRKYTQYLKNGQQRRNSIIAPRMNPKNNMPPR